MLLSPSAGSHQAHREREFLLTLISQTCLGDVGSLGPFPPLPILSPFPDFSVVLLQIRPVSYLGPWTPPQGCNSAPSSSARASFRASLPGCPLLLASALHPPPPPPHSCSLVPVPGCALGQGESWASTDAPRAFEREREWSNQERKKREKGAGSQVGGGGRGVKGERERGELSRSVQERPSPPRRAGGPCLPPTPLCVPDDPAARAGVGGPVRAGEARRLEEGEALWSPFLGWDSAASTSLLGPLCLLASPGRAQAPGWLAGGRGCPTPRPHLAQTTAFRALADGGGTCSRAGPEFASCSGGRRPSQGAAGDAVGKESGKKEKERKEGG